MKVCIGISDSTALLYNVVNCKFKFGKFELLIFPNIPCEHILYTTYSKDKINSTYPLIIHAV